MVAFLIYACLVLAQIILLIILGCSDAIEVTADEETVTELLQKDDVLVCVLLFLMSAILLQNYDYIHYSFLRNEAKISSTEFDLLMMLPNFGTGIGTFIFVKWLWTVEPRMLALTGLSIKLAITVLTFCNVERFN